MTGKKISKNLLLIQFMVFGILILSLIPSQHSTQSINLDDSKLKSIESPNLINPPKFSAIFGWQLNNTWGGSSDDVGMGVSIDSLGNVYLVGYTNSFGGYYDAFLAKYNSSGGQLWNHTWGGGNDDLGNGVAVDPLSNSVYLAGQTLSFGAGQEAFLAKYNTSGKQVWNVTWGTGMDEEGQGVIFDPITGNVYLVGTTSSSDNAFLVKYNSYGTQLWNLTWGGGSDDNGMGVKTDSFGNIYIVGFTDSFGKGNYDAFLAKYNSTGGLLWNRTWGGSGIDYGFEVAVDQFSSSVYIAGYTNSFGGNYDAFLVKYSSSGKQLWNHTWGGSNDEYNYGGLAVDPSTGDIYLLGQTLSFGAGGWDAFLAKYDSSGTQVWNSTWGKIGTDRGMSLAFNPSLNSIYLAGITNSFGASGLNAFLAKYVFNPHNNWNITWGGFNSDRAYDIIVDSSKNVFIVGLTNSFSGSTDVFVAKYNYSGNSVLNITFGDSSEDRGKGIALDDEGNIYITGIIGSHAFIAKFNSSGHQLFNTTWEGSVVESSWDIALDNSQNIYITGETNSYSPDGHFDAFIVKFSNTGKQLFNKTWGTPYDEEIGHSITLDGSGNIYIAGYTDSFGVGGLDAYIAKFNSSGNSVLNITWGGSSDDRGFGIALDEEDNIYMGGDTQSFGAGGYDTFIVKYNKSGKQIFNKTWGGSSTDYGWTNWGDITLDCDNNIFLAASTSSFGAGGYDAFVAKFDSSGNSVLNITWGGSATDRGFDITSDKVGSIYITGMTQSFGSGGEDAFIAKYERHSNINFAPNVPIRISPSNNTILINKPHALKVNVTDLNGDVMSVFFYNASNNALIGSQTGVSSSSVASVIWSGFHQGVTYGWYAKAFDGFYNTTSLTWYFTIAFTTIIDGAYNFSVQPNSGDFEVNTSLLVSDDTIISYACVKVNPTNIPRTNAILFINISLNETNLVGWVNITIKFNLALYNIIRLWWFNETANGGVGSWEEITFINLRSGVILFSVNHLSTFSLTNEIIQSSLPSTVSDGNGGGEGPNPTSTKIDLISIIVRIMILVAIVAIVVIGAFIVVRKRIKVDPIKKKKVEKSIIPKQKKIRKSGEDIEQKKVEKSKISKQKKIRKSGEGIEQEMIICPYCSAKNPSTAESCSYCKTNFKEQIGVLIKEPEIPKVTRKEKKAREQLKQMEKLIKVSKKIKLEMIREGLKLSNKEFTNKLVEWADKYNLTIDGDYLLIDKDSDISKFMEELDENVEDIKKPKIVKPFTTPIPKQYSEQAIIEMGYKVFICHSSKDKDLADKICQFLEKNEIKCWIAPRDPFVGINYAKSITKAIASTKLMLFVLTKNSNNSEQVVLELENATNKKKPIITFRTDNIDPDDTIGYYIKKIHWLDALTLPLEEHLKELLVIVKTYLIP